MSDLNSAHAADTENDGLTPGRINSLLFYELAQFVVWGHTHAELAAAHPELAGLLKKATEALSRGGIPDLRALSVPSVG